MYLGRKILALFDPEEKVMTKWIKWPAAGQYRGDGEWRSIDDIKVSEAKWQEYKETGFLPVHEGDAPPDAQPADA